MKIQNSISTENRARKIPLHCSTRWNSTYLMLPVALEYRDALDIVAATELSCKKLDVKMTDAGWETFQEIIELVEPFSSGSNLVFKKGYPTISTIIPVILSLKNHIQEFSGRNISWEQVQLNSLLYCIPYSNK